MRVGEVQNLRHEDVDLQHGWFHIKSRPGAETKPRQSRKVPIHPVLRALLGELRRRSGPFFFAAESSERYPAGGHQISPKH
jgi:integrase